MNRRERKLIAKRAGVGTHNISVTLPPMEKPLIREYKKIGRNEFCPCGSHMKYKDCCMKTLKYENYK